jgi:tight adherence protein C
VTGLVSGAAIGSLAGVGLCWTLFRLPIMRRPRLDDRLAPYLRDAPRQSRLLHADGSVNGTLGRILRPVLDEGIAVLERVLGGSTGIRRRLQLAGRGQTLEQFRAEQVVWGAAGLAGGLVLSLLLIAADPRRPVPALLLLSLIAGVAGVLVRDQWLTREVRAREARMAAEFPTIAELLALSVTAGEGPTGALERVTRSCHGELSRELGAVLAESHAGTGLVAALDALASRTSLPALARFASGAAVAIERGSPLAEVLRAQAVDARESGKRALLELGGKKEIAMMVPVVFLILPITVLFALFPGFFALNLSTL